MSDKKNTVVFSEKTLDELLQAGVEQASNSGKPAKYAIENGTLVIPSDVGPLTTSVFAKVADKDAGTKRAFYDTLKAADWKYNKSMGHAFRI